MILLPWFSSATLTAASNPKKGQGFPQKGFTETCVWGTSWSSFSVIPEVITLDTEGSYFVIFQGNSYTPVR